VRVAGVIKPRPKLWSSTTRTFTTVAVKMIGQLNRLKGARSYTYYMRAVYERRAYEDVKLFEMHKGTGGHVLHIKGPERVGI
jgi:hypothetical protein